MLEIVGTRTELQLGETGCLKLRSIRTDISCLPKRKLYVDTLLSSLTQMFEGELNENRNLMLTGEEELVQLGVNRTPSHVTFSRVCAHVQ